MSSRYASCIAIPVYGDVNASLSSLRRLLYRFNITAKLKERAQGYKKPSIKGREKEARRKKRISKKDYNAQRRH